MSEVATPERKLSVKKSALGRGLGSLLGASVDIADTPALGPANSKTEPSQQIMQIHETQRIWKISIEKLSPQPNQPRKVFDSAALEELAQSIKAQGILQPIVARRKSPEAFEIIAGERRWRAAQIAGLQEVPVILFEIGDQQSLELALIENIQREDLNPMEEALAYAHLLEVYNLTQQQLAEKIGKDRVTIANTVRLLQLSHDVRQMVSAGEISHGQAKVLLMVSDTTDQKKLALKILREKLSVRACERLIAQYHQSKIARPGQEGQAVVNRSISDLTAELQKIVGTKVSIDYNQGQGRMSLHFYSDEELDQIVQKVRHLWQKPNHSK